MPLVRYLLLNKMQAQLHGMAYDPVWLVTQT
jgi:hypothetical protein